MIYLAAKLKESGGSVVRYGGDEFLVLFDSRKHETEIQKIFEVMMKKFDQISFKIDQISFKISFAYGVTYFHPGTLVNIAIDAADKAMYRHKRG